MTDQSPETVNSRR